MCYNRTCVTNLSDVFICVCFQVESLCLIRFAAIVICKCGASVCRGVKIKLHFKFLLCHASLCLVSVPV